MHGKLSNQHMRIVELDLLTFIQEHSISLADIFIQTVLRGLLVMEFTFKTQPNT